MANLQYVAGTDIVDCFKGLESRIDGESLLVSLKPYAVRLTRLVPNHKDPHPKLVEVFEVWWVDTRIKGPQFSSELLPHSIDLVEYFWASV